MATNNVEDNDTKCPATDVNDVAIEGEASNVVLKVDQEPVEKDEEDQKSVSCETNCEDSSSQNSEAVQSKNYKNVILEDWDIEAPQDSANSNCNSSEDAENLGNNNNNNNNVNNNNNTDSVVDNDGVKDAVASCNNNVIKQEVPTTVNSGVDTPGSGKAPVSQTSKSNDEVIGGVCEKKSDLSKGNDIDRDLKPVLDKKKNPLKYSNLIVSNQDIVEILDNSVERVCRPIIPAKDIFLSIELTKHLHQKLNPPTPEKKAAVDGGDKKNVSNSVDSEKVAPQEGQLTKTGPRAEESKTPTAKTEESAGKPGGEGVKIEDKSKEQAKKGKKKTGKKFISLGDELERTIALRQLRDEFPSTRKRSHAKKKVNHIPFLASSVLEKALTSSASPSNKSGATRRRPCYLPENLTPGDEENSTDHVQNEVQPSEPRLKKKKAKEGSEENDADETLLFPAKVSEPSEGNYSSPAVPVVRTYCIKRKSTESEAEEISAIQSYVSATKELNESEAESRVFKPKKQKTVVRQGTSPQAGKVGKSPLRKSKTEIGNNRKRNELEMLLGDEGAVRMLYDTQHKDDSKPPGKKPRIKTPLGLKKDLMLKTKLVKNAVLRLSGVGSDGVSLRGKRRSMKADDSKSSKESDSFITSAPNVIFYKTKKKQRAEASRILYRHSSSESFDSGEECRRASFEGEAFNSTNNDESNLINGETVKEKEATEAEGNAELVAVSKKAKVPAKTKGVEKRLKGKRGGEEKSESSGASNSKLIWSNVPVRKSSRPRVVSKKYSIWASTSMDSLSVESLGLKKPKKASQELGKKLNYKELRILQQGNLVEIILAPTSTVLKSSLNEHVLTELREAFEFLATQDSCHVILLTSNGTTFCQGIDLNYVLSVEEEDRKFYFGNLLASLKALILCLVKYKKPIIAGVHAGAIGLGVTLLTYCDIVISSDTATFYTPYARLGQASEGAATVSFPRISRNLVTELLYKSEKLSASEALKHGLVSQIIPEERFEEELMLLSKRVASYSVQAMQSMKFLVNKCDYERVEETLETESELVLEHWCSHECINNIIKFLNSGEVQFRQLDVT